MEKERNYLEDLFLKYQQGLVNEEEKELLARWFVHLDISDQELTESILLEKEQLSVAALRNACLSNVPAHKIARFSLWIRTVAATILVALTTFALFYVFHKKHSPDDTQPIYTELVTHRREMKIITLTDGTKITLNNESRIRFPSVLTGKTREVFLTGEAFFEVVHNSIKPFLVHTDKVKVQVFGTSFDIKAYPKDKRLYVSVASGKVGVMPTSKSGRSYFLTHGDQLSYNRTTGKFNILKIDAEDITSWQKGIMIFNNEPISVITSELERFYKVTFLIRNKSLLMKEISLKIKNQSLKDVMRALSISGKFQYEIGNSRVTIW